MTLDMKTEKQIEELAKALHDCDAVVVGAGAGLSTAAGFSYVGPRLRTYFQDFCDAYGFRDMYSGGFYPFETPEEFWAYWSRYIYINRYMDPPTPLYKQVLALVRDKEYFVLTTNVDHCFQKAGVDKAHLFYTQGDYGLFQCSYPCHQATYDNEEIVHDMVLDQGFAIAEDRTLLLPETGLSMKVSSVLVPYCPQCGRPMAMNLRADDTFVEDQGWHEAAHRYHDFIERFSGGNILFLELGVGGNTPVIIKYPFWRMTASNPQAVYAPINLERPWAPEEIAAQTIAIQADIAEVISRLSTIQ